MIDVSKAKKELNDCELYAIKWFDNLGFNVKLTSQNSNGTGFYVTKNGISDTFRLTANRMYKYAADLELYLQQWYDSYLRKVENTRLKEELKRRNNCERN